MDNKMSEGTTLCADSYFRNHASVKQTSRTGTPFLFLCKRDEFGVHKMKENLRPCSVATGVRTRRRFAQHVYKNPKVGRKPPRVVAVLTTCNFEPKWWWSGTKEILACIGAYRQLAGRGRYRQSVGTSIQGSAEVSQLGESSWSFRSKLRPR